MNIKKIFPIIILLLTFAACNNSAHHTQFKGSDLPVSKVVIYQNGVGYIERFGRIESDTLSLQIRSDQINDILKSLTVIDLGTGKPLSISLPVEQQTLDKLAILPPQVQEDGGLIGLLEAFRGANVKITLIRGSIEGRIIGIEDDLSMLNKSLDNIALDKRISLLQKDGSISIAKLSEVRNISLYDDALKIGLSKSLDLSLNQGTWKPITLDIKMSEKGSRDVKISYIISMPTWKPAYRLVIDNDNQALLQSWAIIDNVSGSDWNNVKLSLVSGQPMSFTYDLYKPRLMNRPDLSFMAPDTAIAPKIQHASYGIGIPLNNTQREQEMHLEESKSSMKKSAKDSGRAKSNALALPSDLMAANEEVEEESYGAQDYNQKYDDITADDYATEFMDMATTREVGAFHTYDLTDKYTINNGESAMVNLIQMKVPSLEAKLFDLGRGTQQSSESYHTVQWVNTTGTTLQAGPVTIYKEGAFLGEGFLTNTENGATAQLTFALENRVQLSKREEFEETGSRITKIQNEKVYLELNSNTVFIFNARNNANEDLTISVKLQKEAGWTLDPKPEGTTEASNAFYIQQKLTAKQDKEFKVTQKQPVSRVYLLNTPIAYRTIKEILKKSPSELPETLTDNLQTYLKSFEQLEQLKTQIRLMDTRKYELEKDEVQISRSLADIKDIKSQNAETLKNQLIKRQRSNETELAKIATEKAELRAQESALTLEFSALIRELNFEK